MPVQKLGDASIILISSTTIVGDILMQLILIDGGSVKMVYEVTILLMIVESVVGIRYRNHHTESRVAEF